MEEFEARCSACSFGSGDGTARHSTAKVADLLEVIERPRSRKSKTTVWPLLEHLVEGNYQSRFPSVIGANQGDDMAALGP